MARVPLQAGGEVVVGVAVGEAAEDRHVGVEGDEVVVAVLRDRLRHGVEVPVGGVGGVREVLLDARELHLSRHRREHLSCHETHIFVVVPKPLCVGPRGLHRDRRGVAHAHHRHAAEPRRESDDAAAASDYKRLVEHQRRAEAVEPRHVQLDRLAVCSSGKGDGEWGLDAVVGGQQRAHHYALDRCRKVHNEA